MARQGATARRAVVAARWRGCGWLVLPLLLVACGAGVNEDLVATETPYPIRSPVAATAPPIASPDATLAGALEEVEATLARGDLTGARVALETASVPATRDPAVLLHRAELRRRFGDYAGAIADYDAAIAIAPGNAAVFVGRALANVELARGDQARYDHALADLSRALALDPSDVEARLGPVLVLVVRARFDGNPRDWEQALVELDALGEVVPADQPLRVALTAQALSALGETERARTLVAEADSAGGSGADLALLRTVEAELALAAREWQAASRAASEAIAADPLAWDARRALVAALIGAAEIERAEAAVEEVLSLLPEDGEARYLQGMIFAAQGREAEARDAYAAAAAALRESAVYQARIAEAVEALDQPGDSSRPPASAPVQTPQIRRPGDEAETPTAGVVRQ